MANSLGEVFILKTTDRATGVPLLVSKFGLEDYSGKTVALKADFNSADRPPRFLMLSQNSSTYSQAHKLWRPYGQYTTYHRVSQRSNNMFCKAFRDQTFIYCSHLLKSRVQSPMSSNEKISINPIGYVKTEAVGDEVKDKSRVSQIILNDELVLALEGIREYSHLLVIFFMTQIPEDKRMILKVHPRGRMDMPLLGVFATRTNLRPNPIGLTLVELLKVEDNTLTVRGLDAFDGTPILDIKPFDPWDTAQKTRVPDWWLRLNEKE